MTMETTRITESNIVSMKRLRSLQQEYNDELFGKKFFPDEENVKRILDTLTSEEIDFVNKVCPQDIGSRNISAETEEIEKQAECIMSGEAKRREKEREKRRGEKRREEKRREKKRREERRREEERRGGEKRREEERRGEKRREEERRGEEYKSATE